MRPRMPGPPAALLLDTDPATLALLREWLNDAGWSVAAASTRHSVANGAPQHRPVPFDLVLIDLAFPRRDDAAALGRIASRYDDAPLLALSATFHANVEPRGEVARALGVAGVLPKPIRREALMRVVRQLAGALP